LSQAGTASYDGETFRLPLSVRAERIVTGNDPLDARLVGGEIAGLLTLVGSDLAADNTRVTFPDLLGELTLRGDLANGAFALAGPIRAHSVSVPDVATVTADAKVLAKFGSGIPWSVNANLAGVAGQFDNASIANVAGETLRFRGRLGLGSNSPIVLRDVTLDS
jgi:translocation and assembly module TamB